ncbi:MAG: WYL domain-containing protein [Clostridiales bacterium]|nr:WYL domain-containing protein [Clostridiales bacterium]
MAQKKTANIYVLQYLYKYTDDDHGVSTSDIIKYLEKKGISLNERSIPTLISSLNECFEDMPYIEIQGYSEGVRKYYRLIDRPVEYTEAEMIASALGTVQSFSRNDVKNLKSKIYSLLSKYQIEKVIPALSDKKKEVTKNGGISWNLEVINRAIIEEKKILTDYNGREGVSVRKISPYKLYTNRDGIYILGKCDEHKTNISRFRIDRIEDIRLLEEQAVPCENGQELSDMIKYSKDMSFGEKGTAVYVFTKKIEKVIYDRYGADIKVYHLSDGRMRVSVDEYFSNTLLGWIFSMGRDIEVIGSTTLVNMMKNKVNEWADRLKEG